MHLIIGFISALATLLFALDRLGVDIGWLNPWAWRRRRRWMKQLSANPAYNLDSPMEAIALLLLATARIDGDLSSEEKNELKTIFETTFKLSSSDASSLLSSSTYLLGDGESVFNRPDQVLEKSLEKFTPEQKSSSLELLRKIAQVGGPSSPTQSSFIAKITEIFEPDTQRENWR